MESELPTQQRCYVGKWNNLSQRLGNSVRLSESECYIQCLAKIGITRILCGDD